MMISKRNKKSICEQNEDCSYNYKGIKNALVGKTSFRNNFEIKRIVVIQFD